MDPLRWFNLAILGYYVVLNAVYLLLIAVAFRRLRTYVARVKSVHIDELVLSSANIPISLLVPAYNEVETITSSVRSLLTLRYSEYEVIVVNDGSSDATLQRLIDDFGLHQVARLATGRIPTARVRGVYESSTHDGLYVIDKENGGKADALNAGINHARGSVFCAMDADTILESDALARIVRPFLEDETTIAVGGIVRIANGCRIDEGLVSDVRLPHRWLARFQVLEYLRAFLASRVGWDAFGGTIIISGAFGAFRRSVAESAGGYATDTVGEDMELVVRLHRYARDRSDRYRIGFVPDPVAWTEVPEKLSQLSSQRDRWQRGLADVLWRHRSMMFRRRYGVVGWVAMPFFLVFELLSPVVELLGWLAFGIAIIAGAASPEYVAVYLALAVLVGSALSIASLALEELSFQRYNRFGDLVRLIAVGFLESFGYRQLALTWRLRGLLSFLRGNRAWGEMRRQGFTGSAVERTPRSVARTK